MTVTSNPVPAVLTPRSTTTARTRLTGVAAALAGLGITIGHGLSVRSDQPAHALVTQFAEHRSAGIVGGLLVAVGAFMLLPALAGILSLVGGRGSVLATVGAVLAGCGAAALGAGDVMSPW